MEEIELNSFVTVCKPEIRGVPKIKYDIEEAQTMCAQKRKLVDVVFVNIGAEYYGEISAILYDKCFGQIGREEISRHIMYRALIGTMIDSDMDEGNFVYDKYDKTMETFLSYIVYADSLEEALKIINAIKPDLDDSKNVVEKIYN